MVKLSARDKEVRRRPRPNDRKGCARTTSGAVDESDTSPGGYDRRTDQMKIRYEIPSDTLAEAKREAGVASDDPGAAWSYPLSADQARAIAGLIRAPIDPDSLEFFLEPFADLAAESAPG